MYVLAPNQAVDIFPYSISDLRRDHPNTSFPKNPSADLLASWGLFPVEEQLEPSYDPASESVAKTPPVLENGKWVIKWEIRPATVAEIFERKSIASSRIREERNTHLADSDWTQLPDAPVNAQAWASYRQALRDITEQPGFPWDVQWPMPPTA